MDDACQCSGPGHCPTFGRKMTARQQQICSGVCPPDVRPVPGHVRAAYRVKWAGAGPKVAALPLLPPPSDSGRPAWARLRTLRPPLPAYHYVTTAALIQDTVRLVPFVPADVDAVVGVARSGLLPATAIATMLHLPMMTLGATGEPEAIGSGGRMRGVLPAIPSHVLLVDDTVGTGRSMRSAEFRVRAAFPDAQVARLAVYAHPQASGSVDLLSAFYPGKHYLEWNWQNAGHGMLCGYDFDGILCQECPRADDDDGPRYRRFLDTARPLFLPRRGVVPIIATARHERYRPETEAWLARHGVRVKKLVMRDWDYPADRVRAVAEWKAGQFAAARVLVAAESEPAQAAIINGLTGLPVICPAAGKVFPPKPRPSSLAPAAGPGTELKKLLASVGINPNACSCHSRVSQMDAWGVDGCRERRAEIVGWLRGEYRKRKWSEVLAAGVKAITSGLAFRLDPLDPLPGLVDEAIRRAEAQRNATDSTVPDTSR